jgi:AraC-like DNA-binding protein
MREDSAAIPFALHPEAASLAQPFQRRLKLIEAIDASADLIREAIPLRGLVSRSPRSAWWHYGANLLVGSVVIAAGVSRPARGVVEQQRGSSVIVGYGGELRFRQGSRTWKCRADSCLLLAGEGYTGESDLSSAVGFQLAQERLLRTAMVMGCWSGRPPNWNKLVEQAHGWHLPADAATPSLQAALRQLLTMADQLADYSHALVDRLQLDDQIYRLMAAMLVPELQRESPLDRLRHRESQGKDSFDELIDYIKANLDQPLNLTELEGRSHYSRRALQYAFRERLGCTASQWIRQQRLDRALSSLQNPRPGDSVATIAMASGYRSLSLFSVDFQQRFHTKPSQLLRESRASLPPEAG